MDIIFIRELRVDCIIGIYDWERRVRQTLVIDLEMGADIAAAAASDAIADTLNYKAVAKRVTAFVESSGFNLVETLTEGIAGLVRKEFGVPWVRVRVDKAGAVRGAEGVGVVIERGSKTLGAMTRAYVSIGSNIDPRHHVTQAVAALRQAFGALTLSPVYETAPVGFDGDSFLNLVVGLDTQLGVDAVRKRLKVIETAHGRPRRDARFGPRVLDLDLLLYGDRVGNGLPREDILRYAFVLRPLADIAGKERHPVTGQPYSRLWELFDGADQTLREVTLELD